MTDAKAHGLLYGDMINAPQDIAQDLEKCGTLLKGFRPPVLEKAASAQTR
jgi:preprotein translocase subunit SecY